MNSRRLSTLSTLVLLVLLPVGLHGQMTPDPGFAIDVPFSFVAGDRILPAGHYTVSHVMNSNWIRVVSDDGLALATLQIVESKPPRGQNLTTGLIFHQYGYKYFLAQVLTSRDNQVHDCFKSREERTLARNLTTTQVALQR